MDESFGNNPFSPKQQEIDREEQLSRIRERATPEDETDPRPRSVMQPQTRARSRYSPKRSRSPMHVADHEVVQVHPSHQGSTYQRKQKKKKKKVKRRAAATPSLEEDATHYFLAPIPMDQRQKSSAIAIQNVESFSKSDESEEEVIEPVISEKESVHSETDNQPQKMSFVDSRVEESPTPSLEDSQFTAKKIMRQALEDFDYDRALGAEDMKMSSTLHFGGGIAVQVESEQHLYEPQKDDYEFQEHSWNNGLGNLSYSRVKRHQYKFHPRDRKEKKKFAPFGADISFLPISACQINKSEWVTPCAREIGLGPTLFILTQKAFMYLFLALTVINIPLFMFYNRGGSLDNSGAQSKQFTDKLARLSLGNVGTSEYSCANVNVARNEKSFNLYCQYGTMREFTEFGLQKIDNQSCIDNLGYYLGENKQWDDLQVDCTFETGLTEEGKEGLRDAFQKECYDQAICHLSFNFNWLTYDCRNRIEFYSAGSQYNDYANARGWAYYERDFRRREPVFFANTLCVADKVYKPVEMGKETFIYIMLFIDVIVVGLSIWFINLLWFRYHEYAEAYDMKNVEMRDFTLKFGNLPNDYVYGGKDLMLQCQLWNHIETCMRRSFEDKARLEGDTEQLGRIQQECSWEISDIVFEKDNSDETDVLETMDAVDRKKKVLIHQVNQMRRKGQSGEMMQAINQQIIDLIKQYRELKKIYVQDQEEKLYNKYEVNELNGKQESHSNKYAYVTFRSMKGKERAEKVFKYAEANSKQQICDKNVPHIREIQFEKKFFDHWLTCESVIAPSNIKWRNVNVSFCERLGRTLCMWLFAIVLIVIAFCLMVWFKDFGDGITRLADTNIVCPEEGIEPRDAGWDYNKHPKQRQGKFACYCQELKNKDQIQKSSEQLAPFSTFEENPCDDWEFAHKYSTTIITFTGIMISIINGICVWLFEAMAPLEKCLTIPTETKAIFNKIVIVQFLNIACILLFADFHVGKQTDDKVIELLKGNFVDFDTMWYHLDGAKIQLAMITNCVAPFTSKLIEPILVMTTRYCCDRNKNKHLLKQTNIEDAIKAAESAAEKERRIERTQKVEKAKAAAYETNANQDDKEKQEDTQDLDDEKGQKDSQLSIDRTSRLATPLSDNRRSTKGSKKRVQIKEEQDSIASANSKNNLNQDEPLNDGGESEVSQDKDPQDIDNEDQKRQRYQPRGNQDEETPQEKTPKQPINKVFTYEECGPDEPETQLIFQDELNEHYTNPMMAVFYLYAWFFTNLLVFYTYGGAMPFMYALGVIFFGLSYLVWKFLSICFYRKTYGFDDEIPLFSVKLMKFALLCHLAMIIFMYSDRRLMTPPDYDIEIHYRPQTENFGGFFSRRFNFPAYIVILIYAVSLCIGYCIYRCIVMPIIWWHQAEKDRIKAVIEEDNQEEYIDPEQAEFAVQAEENFSDDIYKELNIVCLRDMYIRSKKEYEYFRTMINSISYDTNLLSDEYTKNFKKNLKMRIQIIEDTIDVHLNLIGGLEQYIDRTYLFKLAVLDLNEERLKQKDAKCLRMNDLTQSFYIYEQREYQHAKFILNRIDRELLELDQTDRKNPVYC